MTHTKHGRKYLRQDTPMVKPHELQREWIEIDASGLTLGRLASQIAIVLRGKHKPTYTPHVDCGDGVIVTNIEKVKVTGMKEARKLYRWYTGHIGGLREMTYRDMMERKPEYILQSAVKGMMPKTRQGRKQLTRLRLVVGAEHNHAAQKPVSANV